MLLHLEKSFGCCLAVLLTLRRVVDSMYLMHLCSFIVVWLCMLRALWRSVAQGYAQFFFLGVHTSICCYQVNDV